MMNVTAPTEREYATLVAREQTREPLAAIIAAIAECEAADAAWKAAEARAMSILDAHIVGYRMPGWPEYAPQYEPLSLLLEGNAPEREHEPVFRGGRTFGEVYPVKSLLAQARRARAGARRIERAIEAAEREAVTR